MSTLPPLALVSCGILRADPRLASLTHVALLLTEYLDVSPSVSLVQASASRSLLLFNRVVWRFVSDPRCDRRLWEHSLAGAMAAALTNDDLAIVRRIHELHPQPLAVRSLKLAFRHGRLETVQWVLAHRRDHMCSEPGLPASQCRECMWRMLSFVAQSPDAGRILSWLDANGYELSTKSAVAGLHSEMACNIDVLRWVHDKGLVSQQWAHDALRDQIQQGKTDHVLWLLDAGYSFLDGLAIRHRALMQAACQCNDLVVDKLLASGLCDAFKQQCIWTTVTTPVGSGKVLQWNSSYVKTYPELNVELMRMACSRGNLVAMQWLYLERGVTIDLTARRYGSELPQFRTHMLAMYQWLDEVCQPTWTGYDLQHAVYEGWLDVVQWLHARPLDGDADDMVDIMNGAASQGHMEILQWLHMNRTEGCSEVAMNHAASAGHLDIVQWLYANRTENCPTSAMAHAAGDGHLGIVMWLYANCPEACTRCARRVALRRPRDVGAVSPGILRWLTDHRAKPCDGDCEYEDALEGARSWTVEFAAQGGDLPLLQYLYENHRDESGLLDPEVLDRLRDRMTGHERMIQWLDSLTPTSTGTGTGTRKRQRDDWGLTNWQTICKRVHQ